MTREDVARESGVPLETVEELETYGILVGDRVAGEIVFGPVSVHVVVTASALLARGIEARHLRGYKLAAEREAALMEQIVTPLLRQRNPAAMAEAKELTSLLVASGAALRTALIRQFGRGLPDHS